MPSGDVAPGWVLPTCGFGHHQVAARPCAGGRSVAAVPMKGSMCSMISPIYPRRTLRLVTPRLSHPAGRVHAGPLPDDPPRSVSPNRHDPLPVRQSFPGAGTADRSGWGEPRRADPPQGDHVHPNDAAAPPPRPPATAGASGWYLVAGTLAVIGFLLLPVVGLGEDSQTFFYAGISAATTGAVLVGARRIRQERRLPWLLLAAGQFSYTLGDIAYYLAHGVLGNEAFPAPADLFYLLQYPLVCWALVVLVRRRTPSRNAAPLLDASILAIGLGMLWWVYLIGPAAAGVDDAESAASRLVSIAYPLMDLVVLVVAIRLAVGAGANSTAVRLLRAGLVGRLLGDFV